MEERELINEETPLNPSDPDKHRYKVNSCKALMDLFVETCSYLLETLPPIYLLIMNLLFVASLGN